MRVRKLYNEGGQVASTILQQLGGANRLNAMTGAYNFMNLGNGLSFKIKNQKANYIKIMLTSMDLYDIEVGRIRGFTYKIVAEGKGLYAEELKPFIEKATGMYLTLGRGFAKGGMISVDYDGESLKYKIDTDDKYIEVDEVTKQFLSDIALVMDRNFRKLKDTYIFWYDDMSDSDIMELEEVFQTSLTKFAKGGELEDDTFVMLFKAYGFVEKRGSYGTRTFYNVEHNAKIYYDPKYRSISGYVGGGEGNDEVIPYSVDGILDFFIEHDITESESTPFAKGGEISNPYEELLLANGFRKSFEVKKEKFTEYRKGRWYCFIDKKRKEIEVGKYDLDYSDADVKKYGAIREDDAPLYHSDRYTNSFTKFKKFLDNYYILDEQYTKMVQGGNVWDEDLNVYTLVSSKEYFGSDTASDKRRWFRRNGRGLTRDQAKRMAQDYIDRYGKERVYIGNIRHYR